MQKFLSIILLLPLSLSAYEGCAKTKQEALESLSGSIVTKVESDVSITLKSNGDESIEERINSISKSSTKLSLVNIKYNKKDSMICASIDPNEQIQNTHDLVKSALEIDEKNLPQNIDKKIEKVSEYLAKLDEVSYLRAVFYKPSKDDPSKIEVQKALEKKEKILQDIYDNSIAKANSLVFKACASTKEDAFKDLNKQLFSDKTKKKDDEGFFEKAGSFLSSLGSVFSSNDEATILDMFANQVIYKSEDKKECAIIKKDLLTRTANQLLADVKRFDINSLSKLPKKRYDEILNYHEHLNVTKALLEIFPQKYTKVDFSAISKAKQSLANELSKTNPQYVLFSVSGAKNIKITLNDKPVKINEKIYIKTGEHTYTITADGKCPIIGTFEAKLKDEKEISENFSGLDYPKVLFATDKTPNISINAKPIKANVAETIEQCKGSVRYIAKYSGQTKSGEIKLSANQKETIELKFLTADELKVFNQAATKKFETTTNEKISHSLTPISSKSLVFSIKDGPEHGKIEMHEAGSFTYVSDEDFVGRDSFEYVIDANGEESAPKIVNIIVNPSNAPLKQQVAVEDANKSVEEIVKKVEEEPELTKERVDKFQEYLEKLADNGEIEKMKKIQAKYPREFEAVLQRKLTP